VETLNGEGISPGKAGGKSSGGTQESMKRKCGKTTLKGGGEQGSIIFVLNNEDWEEPYNIEPEKTPKWEDRKSRYGKKKKLNNGGGGRMSAIWGDEREGN